MDALARASRCHVVDFRFSVQQKDSEFTVTDQHDGHSTVGATWSMIEDNYGNRNRVIGQDLRRATFPQSSYQSANFGRTTRLL